MHTFAIIGAGPSGIYAAEALATKFVDSKITLFDSQPCPYGLVRSGVAPDHEKIKEVCKVFDKTLARNNVSFLGGVTIGKDISIEDLKPYFSAIILSHGASEDRKLGINNENLNNVIPATMFVGWYNAHTDYSGFVFPEAEDRKNCSAVIIGQGNVAIDISRILLKSSNENSLNELSKTDISKSALNHLSKYSFKKVHLIGRRGPLQMACTDKELKELCKLENLSVNVLKKDLELSEEEKIWLESAPKGIQKNYEILTEFSQKKCDSDFELNIRFCLSPHSFIAETNLKSAKFSKTRLSGPPEKRTAIVTEETEEIKTDYAFISVGYKGKSIAGVNFNNSNFTYPNHQGRIIHESGLYTAGWIKRGPSGVIGTNKADSVETVNTIEEDIRTNKLITPSKDLNDLLEVIKSKVFANTFSEWKKLDEEELSRGKMINKSRLKFENIDQMHNFLSKNNG